MRSCPNTHLSHHFINIPTLDITSIFHRQVPTFIWCIPLISNILWARAPYLCTVQEQEWSSCTSLSPPPPTNTPGLFTEFAQIPDTETGHANYTSSTIHNRIHSDGSRCVAGGGDKYADCGMYSQLWTERGGGGEGAFQTLHLILKENKQRRRRRSPPPSPKALPPVCLAMTWIGQWDRPEQVN